jgi:hypothetical protein
MKSNYETVVHHLELAYKNCASSNESEGLKIIIKNLIVGFNKLVDKNKKRVNRRLSEVRQPKYTNPKETLQLIEELIEKEKGKLNETIDN